MANPDSDIELVVFDLGRVLIRICKDWQHACTCAGIRLPADSFQPEQLPRLLALAHRAEVGELDFPAFSREVAPLVGLTPEQVSDMSNAFILGSYPGAVELVDELSRRRVKTACLTNSNDHHWGLLSQRGHQAFFPLDRLTHRFASHLIRARKPQETIYAHVERAAGVAAGSILFFDDVGENVDAARRRGWKVRHIDTGPDDPIPQIRSALKEYRVLTA